MSLLRTPRRPSAGKGHRVSRRVGTARQLRVAVTLAVAVTLVLSVTTTAGAAAAGVTHKPSAPPVVDFGPNVTIFDPSMPTSQIEATFDAIWEHQRNNEMGSDRYALYFLPGQYGTVDDPLQVKVGYYTEVAGLGATPGDVRITGKIESYNRCFDAEGQPTDDQGLPGVRCFALNNFWRTLSNLTLTVNGEGQDGCRGSANFWAVSQAVSLRRVDVQGRQPVPDGLLHRRPAVGQRRVHRRLPGRHRDQRLAAAMVDPQQRGRSVDQRRVEPGVLRCGRRAG